MTLVENGPGQRLQGQHHLPGDPRGLKAGRRQNALPVQKNVGPAGQSKTDGPRPLGPVLSRRAPRAILTLASPLSLQRGFFAERNFASGRSCHVAARRLHGGRAQSGLVAAADLERARAVLPGGSAPTTTLRSARPLLVEQGLLTPYQARKLLAGVTRGFFLGGYRLLRPWARGGMGKVYLAVRESEKTTNTRRHQGPTAARRPRSRTPARGSAARWTSRSVSDHPNIARTLEVGRRGGRPLHGHGVHPRREPLRHGQGPGRRPLGRTPPRGFSSRCSTA